MDEGDLAQLQEIHAALERIERGIYGRCDGCQAAVEEQRLEEVPWERQCGACRAADDAMTGAEPAAGALESSRASA